MFKLQLSRNQNVIVLSFSKLDSVRMNKKKSAQLFDVIIKKKSAICAKAFYGALNHKNREIVKFHIKHCFRNISIHLPISMSLLKQNAKFEI